MQKILVPVDGSIHSVKAAHIAGDLVEKYDGRVYLLFVLVEGKKAQTVLNLMVSSSFGPKLRAVLQAQANTPEGIASKTALHAVGEKILAQAAAKLHHRGLKASVLAIGQGDPVEAILVAAKSVGANTIVLGSRGVTDSKTSSFGSVSHAVFERAECTCVAVK